MSLNIILKDIRHNQLLKKIFFMSNALPKKKKKVFMTDYYTSKS